MKSRTLTKQDIIVLFLIAVIFVFLSPLFNTSTIKKGNTKQSTNTFSQELQQTELDYNKLKSYKGFEDITEEESVKHIESIKKMAKILFYLHQNEQNN